MQDRPYVISIAGFDPSGGAGLLSDCKTFEQSKVMGLGVCTALTLQTASQCISLEWRLLDEVIKAIQVLMENYPVSAVKIGIVKDAEFLDEIIKTVKNNDPEVKIVWDPVLKSTSEFTFFDLETLPQLKPVVNKLSLITPNYNEYSVLKENNLLPDTNKCSLLIKGGHREDHLGTDILVENEKETLLLPVEDCQLLFPKHGSGCVLSSAITAELAKGENMETACRNGKLYIEKFLKSNPSLLGTHS
ncbi:hydroxymethylpyrimidine/phosphomethylpyrimidine kinase [Chryseobacterium bernardetii]|uniref:hydroxymethylpyrimidine kinase n=2 Tax=Chryseobacterium TaxID=59732 RepID=A0A543E4M7_9FLAO|nr:MULTISPECIES: hydroxymethylpyrimidine/phosphomethylpyrimidine kinase [Chryseobacterium]MDR6372793.1 hydroxymethylpyrimidine/phosphomethylpyrimidine kinase [Chryseobacterium vietnamense]MDR6443011.1 hydroxymethylpyrimidine/phosphomethylpyrimidine kinase [Chryseobacterium bernardetii]TQM16503.1 hydroxymethylpyrimidine/phosphomethylpyrimidine kinase [Chryseobacterium aquifrigidense]